MTRILITGANRGIGLEHVQQALAAADAMIACCRAPSAGDVLDLLRADDAPDRLRIEQLDIADPASVDALAGRIENVAIDMIINNAGLFGPPGAPAWPDGAAVQTLAGMDYRLWDDILHTNLIGPFRLTARLLPNLLAGDRKLVVMMSSDLGSITNNVQGFSHAYRSSKAAEHADPRARGRSARRRRHDPFAGAGLDPDRPRRRRCDVDRRRQRLRRGPSPTASRTSARCSPRRASKAAAVFSASPAKKSPGSNR